MPADLALLPASVDALQSIVDNKQAARLVWPGESTDHKDWTGDEEDGPLVVDIITAKLLITVFSYLEKPESKDKFKRMISTTRSGFGTIVDFCWSKAVDTNVMPKGGNA